MNWESILLGFLTFVGAIDLSRIFFPRMFRRERKAEIEGKEKDNESVEVETLRKAIETLDLQLKSTHETVKNYEARNRELSDENGRLKATVTALFDDMCIHKGCRVRKPHQGRGQQWYDQYREDPALGADYLSIETLLKQERLSRLAATKEQYNKQENGQYNKQERDEADS